RGRLPLAAALCSMRSARSRFLLAAAAVLAAAIPAPAGESHTVSRTLEVGGLDRAYRLHVPPGLAPGVPAPLVLVFHGGGGSGAGTERFTRFSDLSDREGFLAAYPDGIGHSWNDGREIAGSRAHRERKFFKAHPKP
ncbi:MAG: hypothetical protein AAB265_10140, partial [candidate division NC10 bacterium]